jgi:hypothetical protein
MIDQNEKFPRGLNRFESDLVFWVLPEDRPGYHEVRRCVQQWKVTAPGRRGTGNYIISPIDERVDVESPLPQVLAYGVVETDKGEISVSVREPMGKQIEFEISKLGPGELGSAFHELRRWTLSIWSPGQPCPKCGQALREVAMRTTGGHEMALALCRTDERMWVYDSRSGMNLPVPITNFYNELMFLRKVRDPKIAFNPRRLFTDLDAFRDSDLTAAFRTYNMIRTKVAIDDDIAVPQEVRPPLLSRLVSFLHRRFA